MLPYETGYPVPPGYRIESRRSDGLVYGGLALWGVPYLGGIVVGASSGFSRGSGWLLVPIAGPFIAMGGRKIECHLERYETDPTVELKDLEQECLDSAVDEVTTIAFLTASGLFQASGALLFVAGLSSTRQYLVREETPRFSLSPILGPHQLGLGARGRF